MFQTNLMVKIQLPLVEFCVVSLLCLCFSWLSPDLSMFSVVPPEELYATQLSQLQEMGFFDTQENVRALRATSGNVHAAVERLLGNSGQ